MTAKSLTHKFSSGIADGADSTLVRPQSNWNADHNFFKGRRTVSGTSDSVADTDHLSLVTYSNGSPIAVTLPAPTGGAMPLGWEVRLRNIGAGLVTITGSGGATINGSSSMNLATNESVDIHSDGTTAYIGLKFLDAIAVTAHGGQLTRSSATQLAYAPLNGGWIKLNGVFRQLSSSLPGLANTSVRVDGSAGQNLAVSTTYYVFITDVSGTLTAEFRTAASYSHAPSTNTANLGTEVLTTSGVENQAFSLIGMIRTNASAQFVDTAAVRLVRSWFNDPGKSMVGAQINGATSASTDPANPGNLGGTISFLTWAGETIALNFVGYMDNANSSQTNVTLVYLDGVGTNGASASVTFGSGQLVPSNTYAVTETTEGAHTADVRGYVGTGPGNWYGFLYAQFGRKPVN
jgi:hypothetical protein